MRTPKFKVGDKVRVLRASTDAEHDLWCDTWCTPDMNEMIGKKYTIGSICTYGEFEYASYDLKGMWRVPEFVLENEVQIGEQLVFDFMMP